MKRILVIFLFALRCALAHDHMEVGEDPSDPARLGLDGPDFQLALYVPPGEPFSGYLPQFPGGWHADELTFSTDVNALEPAPGADPKVELISVDGPAGGSFGFWEVDATSPTWSRPSGWTNSPGDTAAFSVIVFGDGHIHGRAFTMDRPGTYRVSFQVTDQSGGFLPSSVKTVTFVAQLPPPLSVTIQNGSATLSFTSRLNLDYDLQTCADLGAGSWITRTSFSGDGSGKSETVPLQDQSKQYFRLVEY